MAVGVDADRVALVHHAGEQFVVPAAGDVGAEDEEGGRRSMGCESVEHGLRASTVRPVVEGERDGG